MSIEEADLVEYCLGTLDAERTSAVEAALERDPELVEALAEIAASLDTVGEASEPIMPSSALRDRVLDSVTPANKLQGFATRLARMFSVSLAQAEDILSQAAKAPAAPWRPMPVPGAYTLRVRPGAGLARYCTLVYLERGARIPRHRHLGQEQMLVLDGYALESTGRAVGPGDTVLSEPGSEHEFDITADTPCLFAVSLDEGLEWVRWRDKLALFIQVLKRKLRRRQ